MIKHSSIEFLKPELLKHELKLKNIAYWLDVMNRPQGWHYDLDFIWVLNFLESNKIPKNSKILDAGGGLGPFQYILASMGYEVVSLDIAERKVPKEAYGIFEISVKDTEFKYRHEYQKFIKLAKDNKFFFKSLSLEKLKKIKYIVLKKLRHKILNTHAKFSNKNNFGKIQFVRGSFHDIPYEKDFFDAVISISAIEHSDLELFENNINEMVRVVKPNSPVLITTSATNKKKDIFDEQTAGWCFSKETFSKIVKPSRNFLQDYKCVEADICENINWQSRLDPYYCFDRNSPFFKKNIKSLPYLPIIMTLSK